jgi:hypothetical protein
MAVFTHTVPPKFLMQIGDMTVSFATLEFMMQQIFLVLVGQSAVVGMILGSFLSFKNLGSAINSLHRARFGEDGLYSELKDLLAQAAKLEEDRT